MNNYNDFPIIEVSKQELYDIMQKKYEDGWRLSQICSVAFEGYNEVTYSVNLDYTMENYKIKLPVDEEVKSFSDIFPAAALYENEIKELSGCRYGNGLPKQVLQNKRGRSVQKANYRN